MTTFKISTSEKWFEGINKEFFIQCLIQEGLTLTTPGEWMDCVKVDGGRIDAEELTFWDSDCSIINWKESEVETESGVKSLKDVQTVSFEKAVLLNMTEKFQNASPAGHFLCTLKAICEALGAAENVQGVGVIEFKD